jgi:hypothetical protein
MRVWVLQDKSYDRLAFLDTYVVSILHVHTGFRSASGGLAALLLLMGRLGCSSFMIWAGSAVSIFLGGLQRYFELANQNRHIGKSNGA